MYHGFAGHDTGLSEVEPLTCPYKFEEQILLGYSDTSFHDFEYNVLIPLEKTFISTRLLI